MNSFINVSLLSHPYNWLIVILMLAIAVYGLTLLAGPIGTVGAAMPSLY